MAKHIPTAITTAFTKATEHLCAHSLQDLQAEDLVWLSWHTVSFLGSDQKEITFPIRRSAKNLTYEEEERLALKRLNFLDAYLAHLLAPKDMAPNPRMKPNMRAELNKYRSWFLNRMLRQMVGQLSSSTVPAEKIAYILPEDLPKIADDLWLFHKHIDGKDRNIELYPSLNEFNKKIRPFQLAYPISNEERWLAHARFLCTGPKTFASLLPKNWVTDKDFVTTAEGETIAREGGASLAALLEDGTQIIVLEKQEASIAYGSPRWCTAYRNQKNYFNDYREDLLVIIAPNGERWQVHFGEKQFRDAKDLPINPQKLCDRFIGLNRVLNRFAQYDANRRNAGKIAEFWISCEDMADRTGKPVIASLDIPREYNFV